MQSFVTIKIRTFIIVILFSLSFSNAEYTTLIDTMHHTISQKVLEGSTYLDTSISQLLNNDINTSCATKSFEEDSKEKAIDSFFQNDRYLNETKDTFIRLRLNSYFYSKKSNKLNAKLNAQLPFIKCKKKWKLFIQNISLTDKNEIQHISDTSNFGVGIRYYKKEKYGLISNYSLGLNGIHPFVRARYGLPFTIHNWEIEPIQIFKYSSKDYFEEETNIYFDKFIKGTNLFRFKLHRKTRTHLKGMDYGINFQYYFNFKEDTGLRLSQSFFGNTHYKENPFDLKSYSGINNYETSLSWRENIWRKWFYYELRPTVNFHKKHHYKPSYSMRFFIDIYFGKYNK